jgi:hypothetical protein
MSRLYSSPEVTWISYLNFEVRPECPFMARRTFALHRIAAPFETMPISPTFAFNKDAFPNRQRSPPATNHSPCRNKPSSVA